MTKLIAALVIVAVLYGGWNLFLYWDKVKSEEETAKKQAVATAVDPRQLPGIPEHLDWVAQLAEGLRPGYQRPAQSVDRTRLLRLGRSRRSGRSQARFRFRKGPHTGVFAGLAAHQAAGKNLPVNYRIIGRASVWSASSLLELFRRVADYKKPTRTTVP